MVTSEKQLKEFAARFNLALDKAGVAPDDRGRQGAVAKMFGVSQPGARKWLKGEAYPKTARIGEIAKRLEVGFDWLANGDSKEPHKPPKAKIIRKATTQEAEALIKELTDLNKQDGLPASAVRIIKDVLKLIKQAAP